jgi:hypothetical protein
MCTLQRFQRRALLLLMLAAAAASTAAAPKPLLIVGSINADSTISVERLPSRGECITSTKPVPTLAVGGKASTRPCACFCDSGPAQAGARRVGAPGVGAQPSLRLHVS